MLDIFQWGSWLSVMKYSAEILVANEFQELNFTCPIEPGKLFIYLFIYSFIYSFVIQIKMCNCGYTFDNLQLILTLKSLKAYTNS